MNSFPLEVPILSYSSVYFMVWHAMHDRMYGIVHILENSYYSSVIESQRAPGVAAPDPYRILEERVNIWKRYTILQSDLGARAKKPCSSFSSRINI
jgi:hypothetical protein